MKKSLLSTIAMLGTTAMVSAQVFTPGASALPDGTLGEAYTDQVISFTVPATADINSSVLGDPISIPGVPIPIPNPNQEVSADITDVTWAVEGLPAGMTATCDATPCTYVANASGTITISGTPTESGTFTIDITSLTNGSATLPAPISQTFAFPQAVPQVLDEPGYEMFVAGPGAISESNDVFSLKLFPNPTADVATLNVNTTVGGVATLEVFSITGALVSTGSEPVRTGMNRLEVDLRGVPAGIYMVKADINGSQALVRVQKI